MWYKQRLYEITNGNAKIDKVKNEKLIKAELIERLDIPLKKRSKFSIKF